jgi:hypothetical protein
MRANLESVPTALAICIVFFGVLSARSADSSSADDDHLITDVMPRPGSVEAQYSALIERELYVTRGDVARFVQTSGSLNQPEIVVALDPDANKSGYALTATKPTRILAPFALQVRNGVKSWRVLRATAPLPKSTALAIHELWLTMLRQARTQSPMLLEGTCQEFSAIGPDGILLRGITQSLSGKTLELAKIGFSLDDYCHLPVGKRAEAARNIEAKARSLRAKALKSS